MTNNRKIESLLTSRVGAACRIKVTLSLDSACFRDAQQLAKASGVSMSRVVDALLADFVTEQDSSIPSD